jgi:DnaK suppressor protein
MDPAAAKKALESERERLVQDLARLREGRGGDGSSRLDAGADDPVTTYTHELDEGVEVDLEATLTEVTEALGRIAIGTYGACVDCGAEIPAARLSAVPATSRCVDCQRKQEHR